MLEGRIYELERTNERREKAERNNNIVITGRKWDEENLKESVREFLKTSIRVEAVVKRAWLVGRREDRNNAVVELEKWEIKRAIMERKKELDKGIWIDDDMTKTKGKFSRN